MRFPVLAAALLFAATPALAQTPPSVHVAATSKGQTLVNAAGLTLYTYDRDAPGQSNCNGNCATNWPPLAADADASAEGDWSIVTRADGSRQWAYRGRPLYLWQGDHQPGDTTGDGLANGAWHVALAQ